MFIENKDGLLHYYSTLNLIVELIFKDELMYYTVLILNTVDNTILFCFASSSTCTREMLDNGTYVERFGKVMYLTFYTFKCLKKVTNCENI